MSPKTDLSWKKAKSVHKKLNTKEFCFLCLKTTKIKIEDQNGISADHSETQINQPVSLLCVRRHLKLNLSGKLQNKSLEASEEIEVDLCNGCEKVIQKFSVLFQELEKIQMEMDYQLEKINQCISEGAQSPELVQEYSKRMTSDVETLSQLALIDKIRKEISQKCLKVRIGSYQTVEMPKVKTENITLSTRLLQEGDIIEDLHEEPAATFSRPPSPSLPTAYENDEPDCDEPHVDSEVKLELQTNSKSQSPPKTFLRDSSTGKFCCPSCDKTFEVKHYAQVHYESVHLNKTWKCDICNVIFSMRCSSILRHKKNCRKMLQRRNERERSRQHYKFQCVTCEKRFQSKMYLSTHQKIVHSKTEFACSSCTKTFKSHQGLKYHMKNVHFAVAASCKYCNTKFKTDGARNYHQKKCPQKSLLKTEAKSAPKPVLIEETGRFRCPSCTKTYTFPSEVRRHYNRVHLKIKFNCDLCKLVSFSHPSKLAKHKMNCLETLQQRLKDRELRNSFQFQCQTCSKKFKTRNSFGSHKRDAHASIRRFRCDICEKSFKTRGHLRNHRDAVHLKKTYPCKFCNNILKHPSSYYQHVKKCGMKNKGIKLEASSGS